MKSTIFALITVVILFLSAGQMNWDCGWIYLGLYIAVAIILTLVLLMKAPEVLAEHAGIKQGTNRWDVAFATLMGIFGPMVLVLMAGLNQRFDYRLLPGIWSPCY